MKRTIIFLLAVIMFHSAIAQKKLIVTRADDKCNLVTETVAPDQVMFVFFSPAPLQIFHKAMEASAQKVSAYRNGYQTLTIKYEYPNGSINLTLGDAKYTLKYGQIMGAQKTFPPVESGRKYCFEVTTKSSMTFTEEKQDKVLQINTANDAVVILKVFPVDMDFTIVPEPYLSIQNNPEKQQQGEYHIFVKPNTSDGGERKIVIRRKNYADLVIPLGKVMPKDYRVFSVKDDNFKGGSVKIKSIPSDAELKIEELNISTRTGNVFQAPPGITYHFSITKPGYYPYNGTFRVEKAYTEIVAKLRPKLSYLTVPAVNNGQGAKVYVDGNFVGQIPINRFAVLEGPHEIKLEKDGYFPDRKSYTINVVEGQEFHFTDYNLFVGGKVTVISRPEEFADIYVDGKETGQKTRGELFLPEGSHSIEVRKQGFLPARKHIYVAGNDNKSVMLFMKVDEHYRTQKAEEAQVNKWMELAEAGDPDGMYNLAKYYQRKYGGNPKYQQEIMRYLTGAAEAGNMDAQRELAAYYYRKGQNEQAFYWYKKAALQGDDHAQLIVGEMYRTGDGVKKDKSQAKYWWRLSCQAGNDQACTSLNNLGKTGRAIGKILIGAGAIFVNEAAKQAGLRFQNSGSGTNNNYGSYNQGSRYRPGRAPYGQSGSRDKEEPLRSRYLRNLR